MALPVSSMSDATPAMHGPPSVALFATSAHARDSARAQLPLGATVVSTPAWTLTVAAAEAVDCVIVVSTPSEDRHDLTLLARGVLERCRTPVVVCGELTSAQRARLVRLGAAAVGPKSAPPWTLWGEVQCAGRWEPTPSTTPTIARL